MIGIEMEMPKCCYMCNFFIHSQENGILDVTKINFNEGALSFRCCADLHIKRINSQKELTKRHIECPLLELKGDNNDLSDRKMQDL